MSCGFTARMITSLSAMSSALSRVVRTAKARASRARRLSLLLLVTVHCVGRSTPAAKTPRKSASAMFPAPMKPIVRSTFMAAPPTHDDAPSTQRAKGALPRYHLCSPAAKAGALTLSRATRPPFRGARPLGGGSGDGFGRSCGGPRSLRNRSLDAGSTSYAPRRSLCGAYYSIALRGASMIGT